MTIAQLHAAHHAIDEATYRRLSLFVERLLDENTRINLTAIRTAELAWPLHILDSLSISPLITRLKARDVVDLGTGGGVPGIPLACMFPTVRFRLIDATGKKIEAVRRIIEPLGIKNVELIWGRAETLGKSPPLARSTDLVIARAVAKLSALTKIATNFLRPGGHCAFMKSTVGLEREIADAESDAGRSGLAFCETTRYSLPSPHGERAIVAYRRK